MVGSCYCDADNDCRLSTDTSAAAAAANAGGGGGAGATGKLRSSVAQVCQTMPGLGVSDNDATDNRPSRRRHGYDDQNKNRNFDTPPHDRPPTAPRLQTPSRSIEDFCLRHCTANASGYRAWRPKRTLAAFAVDAAPGMLLGAYARMSALTLEKEDGDRKTDTRRMLYAFLRECRPIVV